MNRFTRLQRTLLTWILAVVSFWLAMKVAQMFGHLLTLILTAAVLAFLLNYPVRLLRHYRLSRGIAVTVVFTVSVVMLTLVSIAFVPVLARQLVQFGAKIPQWIDTIQQQFDAFTVWAAEHNFPIAQTEIADTVISRLKLSAVRIAEQSLDLVLGTFNQVIDLVLVLVLGLYMLLYGERFWDGLLSLIPDPWGPRIGEKLTLSFQNFLISQLVLGLIMGVMLVPAFGLIKVPFGLLFGLLIGLLEVIPLIGGVVGIGLVAGLLAFQDIWLGVKVVGVSLLVQQVKDRIIAPRLMGELTGLNPVWILIALLAGAQLGGILGVIVAIPLTSVVKSLYELSSSANAAPDLASLMAGETLEAPSESTVTSPQKDPEPTKV